MSSPVAIAVLAQASGPGSGLEQACGKSPSNACSWVYRHTHTQWLAKVANFTANRLLAIVIIWLVALLINTVVRRLIRRVVNDISGSARSGRLRRWRDKAPVAVVPTIGTRAAARAQSTGTVLRSLSSIVIYGFAAIYTASELGVKLAPLIAGAGVVGVALGFGAQTIVRDFLSGLLLLLEDQFGVGDTVEVASATGGSQTVAGTIEAISLRVTRMRDVQGTVWYIPNGEIRRIGNKSQQWGRAVVDLVVPLDADLAEVEAIIADVADDVKARGEVGDQMIDAPEVWGLESIDTNGMVVRLVAKTLPGSQSDVSRALRVRSIEALREAGIHYGRSEQLVWVQRQQLKAPRPQQG